MVVTCDVDIQLLQQSFDLQPYDAFIQSDLYENLEAAAKQAALRKVRSSMSAVLSSYP